LSRMAPLSAGMNIVGAQPWTTIFFLFPKFWAEENTIST
jgi:hypothetical protein